MPSGKSDLTHELIVIGAVGTARNIIEQINDAVSKYNYPCRIKGILIDSFSAGTRIAGMEVIGTTNDISDYLKEKNNKFLFCLHKPESLEERYGLLRSYKIPNDRFANFIHPQSYFASSASLGVGNVILSNSTVQSNVTLGNFNIINSNVSVEHETSIGNFNFIAANASIGAKVKMGDANFIGLNTSLRERTKLGNNVYAGMNSMLIDNFNECKVYGIPAVEHND